jgi:hypothetical protein
LVAGSDDGKAYFWDVNSGHLQQIIDVGFPLPMYDVCWHPNEHAVAFACYGGDFPIVIHEYADDKRRQRLAAELEAAGGKGLQYDIDEYGHRVGAGGTTGGGQTGTSHVRVAGYTRPVNEAAYYDNDDDNNGGATNYIRNNPALAAFDPGPDFTIPMTTATVVSARDRPRDYDRRDNNNNNDTSIMNRSSTISRPMDDQYSLDRSLDRMQFSERSLANASSLGAPSSLSSSQQHNNNSGVSSRASNTSTSTHLAPPSSNLDSSSSTTSGGSGLRASGRRVRGKILMRPPLSPQREETPGEVASPKRF